MFCRDDTHDENDDDERRHFVVIVVDAIYGRGREIVGDILHLIIYESQGGSKICCIFFFALKIINADPIYFTRM